VFRHQRIVSTAPGPQLLAKPHAPLGEQYSSGVGKLLTLVHVFEARLLNFG
jgi:hypothetical protein